MSYRKTVNLTPATEAKLKEASKRYGVNANRILEMAVDLLDEVDHARRNKPVEALAVREGDGSTESVRFYFRG